MTIAKLIRKGGLAELANANPAKAANDRHEKDTTLARLATLALAKSTELTADDQERQPFDQRHLDAIKAGYAVHVWSGVLNDWLWWVHDETVKTKLAEKKGIDRGLIYTLGELALVIDAAPNDLRNMHAIKKRFGGGIHPAGEGGRGD